MPPSSSTRRTRARREVDIREASDADIQDSSPSRPARKKRRTEPAETVTVARDIQAEDQQDDPSKAEDDMEYTSDAVMNHVITTLGLPAEEMPMVSIDHANAVHEREHRNGVQAYAKISGRDWTYYVKTLRVNLGRPPDPVRQSSESAIQTSPPPTDVEETKVHIDLGPSKLVSRQHATIEYDGDGQYNWQMTVHGRNGVRVDDMFIKRGETKGLTSGMVLEIGGTQMMFVTPDDHPVVHPAFIQQARDEERGIIRRNNHSRQIDARRTDLPSDGKMGGATGDSKLSPAYNRGLNLESTEDIDFSHDSAKDLKPPYSYATMIAQAILSASDEKLTLNSIYTWIMDRYAFYRHSNSGWQNSIRHNLSLNKAFEKIPRRTDEPGKGMKWQIVPGHYEEFTKKAARPSKGAAGQRTSSAPNSPLTRDTSANTSYQGLPAYGPPLRLDPVRDNPSGSNRIKRSATPPSYSVPSKVAYTPTRGPLPHRQNGTTPTDEVSPTHGNNKNGGVLLPTYNTSPPTLSSRYDDENNGASMATPAPRRQNPKLAPPSAAQMPSSYLPTSSPAPFWKYVDVGSTPAKPMGDLSPFKLDKGAPSSPPARRSSAGGPDESSTEDRSIKKEPDGDKEMASNGNGQVGETATTQDDETEGFDLTKGFQAIGKYHTNLTNAAA